MGKGSAPSPPDFTQAAEAGAESDLAMAQYNTFSNRPDQYTPWGSVTWQNQSGIVDGQPVNKWVQNTSLNPEAQAALDAQMNLQQGRSELGSLMQGRLASEMGSGMDYEQFGGQQGLEFNPNELRQRGEDMAYASATSRLAPKFGAQREAMEIKLRNQGLQPGDQVWNSQMGQIDQQETDAYNQAQFGAFAQGRSEQGQMYEQQMGMANYANQLRQNAMKEEMQRRGMTLNEINAIMSGQQVDTPDFQSFNTAPTTRGADYSGAAQSQYGADINTSNFNQAQQQAMMQGLSSAYSMF